MKITAKIDIEVDTTEFAAEVIAGLTALVSALGAQQPTVAPPAPAPEEKAKKVAKPKAVKESKTEQAEKLDVPEPDPITAEQDAADEAATVERALETDEAPALELDDVRAAVKRFADRFGPAKATLEVPVIVGRPVDATLPAELFAVSIEKLDAATRCYTLDDVKAAFRSYAMKFDGPLKPGQPTPNTDRDGVALLQVLFGVSTLKDFPAEPENCAKVCKALIDAVTRGERWSA